ncbi:conserved hypothetical protein [Verticillium alfalfae VaMs.102]|uniref:C6 zinc finger domain-containing protein n=1 Tax=Verticillium alfalfae (strain VaMs.102 / ATCC MYA-4576 / FGSC 10136) TaxID=526221 RepID=C9SA44_VERA1|nr:conserved hypothetical protein [Verticillium alfalfae VaMs.102]EEY16257.1 conserved hypothetical protein [Verticillium alfalfae VaMs.102]
MAVALRALADPSCPAILVDLARSNVSRSPGASGCESRTADRWTQAMNDNPSVSDALSPAATASELHAQLASLFPTGETVGMGTQSRALASPDIARIFHHYIIEIAPWYDLSDPASSFATRLPRLALEMPLPFSAIIAQAAMQICQTTAPSQRTVAEFYHGHCVRLLIELRDDCGSVESEAALAAVCLLRSYEILDEEVDPNRHLHGAYSLASRQKLLLDNGFRTLSSAGFWNYLREDITYSLFEEQPLKMDLENIPMPTLQLEDHDHLNAISLVLGRILNAHFNDGSPGRDQPGPVSAMLNVLQSWQKALPRHFEPLSAARQYFLVSIIVLYMVMPLETLNEILQLVEIDLPSSPSREVILETYALEGMNFAANVPLSADEVTLTPALLTPHPFTPVVGMTPASDSTQIWLGTCNDEISPQKGAHGDRESNCINQDLFEKNQATHELCQSVVK